MIFGFVKQRNGLLSAEADKEIKSLTTAEIIDEIKSYSSKTYFKKIERIIYAESADLHNSPYYFSSIIIRYLSLPHQDSRNPNAFNLARY